MIELYPSLKTFSVLVVLVLLGAAATAQNGDVASIGRPPVEQTVFTNSDNAPAAKVGITGRMNNKVWLKWSGESENVRAYKVERSVNGRSFFEAGVLIPGSGDTENGFSFVDDLGMNYSGPLYYRLRMVSANSGETLSVISFIGGSMGALTH